MIVIGYNGFTRGAEVFRRLWGVEGVDRHNVLGHDAAVAVLVDGELVAAVEEERLNREKKTSAFPMNAMRWCLERAGIAFEDVDAVAFPWQFSADAVRTMISEACDVSQTPEEMFQYIDNLDQAYTELLCRRAIREDFARRTGYDLPDDKLVLVPHHLAHLMCGYYFGGGEDTAFLVSDGRGEQHSSVMGEIRAGRIRLFDEQTINAGHSLGLLFGEITRYLGFVPNNDEYKVMGLSAYGAAPADNRLIGEVVRLREDGTYEMTTLVDDPQGARPHYPVLDRIFDGSEETRQRFTYRATVAAAAQHMIEEVTAHQLRALQARTDLRRLTFEGGLALNCVNNTKLLEGSRFTDVQVSFGASDPGVAIGAAVYAAHTPGRRCAPATPSPYLGPDFDDAQIRAALDDRAGRVWWRELAPGEIADETARLLCGRAVVGWFQGRTEYGPRALGNRSILANPAFADIKDIINARVKHREPFRPFAPVVLEERAQEIFDMGKKRVSPYMTFVFPVRPEFQDRIPGACHVDGTARIQTVNDEQNPELCALLRAFTTRSGVPCLINTSFNVAGEPIVSSPADALDCFLKTEIDHLVLGPFLVGKNQ
ncbi:carbamoyltransferase [Micromonospora sp. STR1_7]|uniref:Carbamoyltransferase n=1 Tax=Micromonospora parastrephiae TaxID=2806101 RepID=A0ABS1XQ70_9ACTN|nr:carbamoyltransferase C-terminal domain-containing protein [Micromonospora parastrephiae]MBM0231404.1 carbamoyltransferase [Micromonospora parastrephiae]